MIEQCLVGHGQQPIPKVAFTPVFLTARDDPLYPLRFAYPSFCGRRGRSRS